MSGTAEKRTKVQCYTIKATATSLTRSSEPTLLDCETTRIQILIPQAVWHCLRLSPLHPSLELVAPSKSNLLPIEGFVSLATNTEVFDRHGFVLRLLLLGELGGTMLGTFVVFCN